MSHIDDTKRWINKLRKIIESSDSSTTESNESNNTTYIPYMSDGEKWRRLYSEQEVEAIKKEAYEQGFRDGVNSCSNKVEPPSGKSLPETAKHGAVFLLEYDC